MNDNDIADMFASTPVYDDRELFESRVMRALRLKLWLRQGLVVLAGFVGGIYALAQFIRFPGWEGETKAIYGNTIKSAAADTDRTLRASAEVIDLIHSKSGDWLTTWLQSPNLTQTPLFFWASFSLCLAALALYYAYSREETI